MSRKRTIGQARELAKQLANFFEEPYVVYNESDGRPEVQSQKFFLERGLSLPAGADLFEPAKERPNEIDSRQLAAIRTGLMVLCRMINELAENEQKVFEGNGKHYPLDVEEIRQLSNRLIVNANKK